MTDITDITYLRHSPYTGGNLYPSNDTNILPLRSSRYTETQMTEYVSANRRTAVSHKNRDSDSDTQPPFERGLVCTVTVTVFQSHQEYHSLEYLLIPQSHTLEQIVAVHHESTTHYQSQNSRKSTLPIKYFPPFIWLLCNDKYSKYHKNWVPP